LGWIDVLAKITFLFPAHPKIHRSASPASPLNCAGRGSSVSTGSALTFAHGKWVYAVFSGDFRKVLYFFRHGFFFRFLQK
jgi:hypothetical protein